MHRHLLPWSAVLIVVCAPPAVRAQEAAVPRGLTNVAGNALTRVLVDQPGDGSIWALAPGYKAHFVAGGVDYIPYFGPKASKNHPLAFRLRSVRIGATELPCAREAAPVFERDRVSYDRGGVVEVWELREAEVEQTFVLAAGSSAGDLVVTVDVASELPCTEVEGGLAFAGGALGEVRYGNLLVCDGQGRRFVGPARWTGSGVELRVPAAFLAAASGPITVDPIVRTISIDAGTDDNIRPDVAYEPGTDRWLVVYERVFSQRDQDIIARRFTGAGDLLEEVAVATGSRESHRPSVAANSASKQFLVVWDEDAGISDRVILGRFRNPASTSQTSAFTVQDSSFGSDQNADVGGSIAPDGLATAAFLVVCESGSAITFVKVSSTGALSAVSIAGTVPTDPRVTKARAPGSGWLSVHVDGNVVNARRVTPSPGSVAQIVDNSGFNGPPDVAGNDDNFLVVYRREVPSPVHGEIRGAQLRFANNVLSLISNVDLTAVEPNVVRLSDHKDPAVSYDGFRFTYAYLEQTGAAANYEAFAATLLPGVAPLFSDSHRALHTSTPGEPERNLRIASTGEMGGDAGRYFIAWDLEASATSHDIRGVLFDGTAFKGGVTTIPTSCGPLHINILAENTPALGTTLRVRTDRINPSSQLYLVGEATLPQTLCTQGCKLGVFSIFFVVPGADLDLPIPRDQNLMGAQFAVQNLVLASLGGCAPPSFALPLVTTDTLNVLIQ